MTDTAPNGDQDRVTDSAADTAVILSVLLPLCDDLPGEPPALIAWSPDVLAQRIGEGLAATGYTITPTHDCAELGHLYDDDWPWPDQADMRALAPGSQVGDPCIWCDHEKGADE